MNTRDCLCCIPMTNAERAEMEREWAKAHPKIKLTALSDHEHDQIHDMRSLNVPPPMSKEDRENYGDFS